MPSLQSLRRKIGAVKNTQKITKAMKMVAAAKLRRAQERILAARPYAHKMRDVLVNLSQRVNRASHPLLQKRGSHRIEVLVVTSDRGLCGAFNANILRKAVDFLQRHQAQGDDVTISLTGRKGRDYFRRRTWPIRQQWVGIFDRLTYEHGLEISQDLIEHFTKGTFDELYVIYNEFKSAIQQRVVVEKLFPVDRLEALLEEASLEKGGEPAPAEGGPNGSYLYEPDEDELLAALLPRYFSIQTFRILLESSSAEQGARMAAMDGATRNAGELIQKLTQYFNKTRQAVITKELMDIVGGAEALK